MTHAPLHIAGSTTHARRGAIGNAFRYGVDYEMIDPEVRSGGPLLFSRNRFNLTAIHDRNHGGCVGAGIGANWAWSVLEDAGLDRGGVTLRLLTQPSYLGYTFNPVSFWIAWRDDALIAVIAEVNNPFGDRHSYLCRLPKFAPIDPETRITASKALHVSPFQTIEGEYHFNFDITPSQVRIRILHENGDEGVIATLSGAVRPLSSRSILWASLRRPAGALRTIALIHWQALILKLKGARYRRRPLPPSHEVSS